MGLKEQVDELRQKIESSFDKKLKKLGLPESKDKIREKDSIPDSRWDDRERAESLIDIFRGEEGSYSEARDKFIDEFSFTLFNRIAALKVMGLKGLTPEPITRRHEHGNRSFAHEIWLEENPEYRREPREGIGDFLRDQFEKQAESIHLFSKEYPYDGFPDESDLLTIIEKFNNIDEDNWESDDIMGWLYEYYNATRKQELKNSNEDIEWDKVSLSSQIYTPRWVVEFLLNNSLGKLWMGMHPDSSLTENHLIANTPDEQTREIKPVGAIKLIDPACGSGNFLLYAYDLFKEMYREEGETPEEEIPRAILENNLHGIDIDHRSVQIAQLSLYIKVMEDTGDGYSGEINVVSTDFHLPDYDQAKDYFTELGLSQGMHEVVKDIWGDLKDARKFGSLIRVKEKLREHEREDAALDRLGLFGEGFSEVIEKLHKAVSSYSTDDGFQTNFLKSQSDQGLQFLEILFKEYDVASANPPYTDSGNYGEELSEFVKENYKRGKNMAQNLYTAVFERNSELINGHGKIATIHPLTFMYIKSYEDMRKKIINHHHINTLSELGMGGVFPPHIFVDPVAYVVEKGGYNKDSLFISLDQYSNTKFQTQKREFMEQALKDYRNGIKNEHNYRLDQEKLKIIDGWPFIYWIPDDFREKFKRKSLGDVFDIKAGLQTSNNFKYLRYWWEIDSEDISENYSIDSKKWVPYSKGGPWKKWYGNLWLCVDWENNGKEMKKFVEQKYDYVDNYQWVVKNEEYYFKEGITYSASGSKGVTFRHLPPNHIFDHGGNCLFPTQKFSNIFYVLGFLNSKLIFYIADCLNPTVNTEVGDLKRVPFVEPSEPQEKLVSNLSKSNVKKKKELTKHDPTERIFKESPLEFGNPGLSPKDSLLKFFDYQNRELSQILLNEAFIDGIIFDVYDLTEEDWKDVLNKQGIPSGQFPISDTARKEFLNDDEQMDQVREFVSDIPQLELDEQELEEKKSKLLQAYQSIGKNAEAVRELSEEFEVNPLTVCEWIEESDVLPQRKAKDHAQKYVLVLAREVLMEDEDGIAPLVEFSGEITLQERIEQKLIDEKDFTQRDINELEDLLGYNLDKYICEHFFEDESNILNKFRFLPKTPFIWHLSSGNASGFEVATIIYKWSRDRLISIKNRYLEKRREAVQRELAKLGDLVFKDSSEENKQGQEERDESPEAQRKREKYRAQLEEIDEFEEKVIDLLESGYDPVIDDGVGYNIAPLQKRGMLKYDPLTSSQLDKFLNTDWGSRAEGDSNA